MGAEGLWDVSECAISQVGRLWDCLLCAGTKGRASVPTPGFRQALPFPGSSNVIQLLKLMEVLNSPFKLLNKSERRAGGCGGAAGQGLGCCLLVLPDCCLCTDQSHLPAADFTFQGSRLMPANFSVEAFKR